MIVFTQIHTVLVIVFVADTALLLMLQWKHKPLL